MGAELEHLIEQIHHSGVLYAEAVREFKKRYLTVVLRECGGNQCKAARQLGMHRNSLSRIIFELGILMAEVKPQRRPPRGIRPVKEQRHQA